MLQSYKNPALWRIQFSPLKYHTSNVVMGKPTHDDVYDRQIRLWGADAQVRTYDVRSGVERCEP